MSSEWGNAGFSSKVSDFGFEFLELSNKNVGGKGSWKMGQHEYVQLR